MRLATRATPAKGDRRGVLEVFSASVREIPGPGVFCSNASSEDGRWVEICYISFVKAKREDRRTSRSSMIKGHPVPTPAYRSMQNAIQNVRLLSSIFPTSVSLGRVCFTSTPKPSNLCRPSIWVSRVARPVVSHALGNIIILNS